MLYPLSYGPVMDPAGFEPATFGLEGDNPMPSARRELLTCGGQRRVRRTRGDAGKVRCAGPLHHGSDDPAGFEPASPALQAMTRCHRPAAIGDGGLIAAGQAWRSMSVRGIAPPARYRHGHSVTRGHEELRPGGDVYGRRARDGERSRESNAVTGDAAQSASPGVDQTITLAFGPPIRFTAGCCGGARWDLRCSLFRVPAWGKKKGPAIAGPFEEACSRGASAGTSEALLEGLDEPAPMLAAHEPRRRAQGVRRGFKRGVSSRILRRGERCADHGVADSSTA